MCKYIFLILYSSSILSLAIERVALGSVGSTCPPVRRELSLGEMRAKPTQNSIPGKEFGVNGRTEMPSSFVLYINLTFTFVFFLLCILTCEFSQFQTNSSRGQTLPWRWNKILKFIISCRRILVKGLSMYRGGKSVTCVIMHPLTQVI